MVGAEVRPVVSARAAMKRSFAPINWPALD
jgi:hypothetical protein